MKQLRALYDGFRDGIIAAVNAFGETWARLGNNFTTTAQYRGQRLVRKLRHAEKGKPTRTIFWLIAHGACLKAKNSWIGYDTALLIACWQNMPESLFRRLIDAGADLNAQGSGTAATALMTIAKTPQPHAVAIAEMLLDAGAHIGLIDNYGCTALHDAIQNDNNPVARFLIERGADIHGHNIFVDRPLDLAAESGNVEIAMLLLKHGADPRYKIRGRTARDVAAEAGHNDLAEMIDFKMAEPARLKAQAYAAEKKRLRFIEKQAADAHKPVTVADMPVLRFKTRLRNSGGAP